MELAWIAPTAPPETFPPVSRALQEPDGLLAVGGDLSPERLLYGYRRGIFPWYSGDQPLLWWSPNPRAVLWPNEIRISRSLRRRLRRGDYQIGRNTAFEAVMRGCAAPRRDSADTWITSEMLSAYAALHRGGFAHSIETWERGKLVGGLYGVALGRVFFGESMFSRTSDASKVALVHLCALGYEMIDCQLPNEHLASLGARLIPREDFVSLLDRWCEAPEVDVRTSQP